jgi:hypothetical protein
MLSFFLSFFFFLFFLFFCDFAGLTSIFSNCRVDICLSWWLKLTGFFSMTRLIFSFLWDFPNSRVHLIFFPFQGHNRDSLLLSAQWFSICPQSCWISLRSFL